MRNKKRFNRSNQRNNDKNFNNTHNNNNNNNKSRPINDMIKFVSTNISKKNDNIQNNNNNNNNNEKNKNENKKVLKLFNITNKNVNQNHNRHLNRNQINNNKNIQQNRNIKPNIIKKNRIYAYKVNVFNKEDCILCSRKILDMTTAIKDDENNKFYHFECILKNIEKKNNISLKPMQRMAYLGSGNFGIVEDFKENGRNKFKIIQKFDYFAKDVL